MGEVLTQWDFDCVTCVGSHATREGILGAIHEFVQATRPETDLVIYFGGHGGQYHLERVGLPAWGLDYLVPVDHDKGSVPRGILDVEISQAIKSAANMGAHVTSIFDCCFITSGPRTLFAERIRAIPTRRITPAELPIRLDTTSHVSPVSPAVVKVLATAPGSPAFECEREGRASGYLTMELCAALENAWQTPVSWKHIIDTVRQRIAERRGSRIQSPQIIGRQSQRPFMLSDLENSDASHPRRYLLRYASEAGSPGAGPTDSGFDVPSEDEFIAGASAAIKGVVQNLHDRGIPTTHLIDGRIVKLFPDGRQQDLGAPKNS
jgi:hypothetical protein